MIHKAAPRLLERLDDENRRVRVAAAATLLEASPIPLEFLPYILNSLLSGRADTRAWCCSLFGESGTRHPSVLAALKVPRTTATRRCGAGRGRRSTSSRTLSCGRISGRIRVGTAREGRCGKPVASVANPRHTVLDDADPIAAVVADQGPARSQRLGAPDLRGVDLTSGPPVTETLRPTQMPPRHRDRPRACSPADRRTGRAR